TDLILDLRVSTDLYLIHGGLQKLVLKDRLLSSFIGKGWWWENVDTYHSVKLRHLQEHLQKDLEQPLKEAQQHQDQTYLIFLDGINTSPEIGTFKEVVCDHSLKGKVFSDNVVIIAALNPFRKRHRTASDIAEDKEEERNIKKYYADDLDKEMCQLVYRVFPLPKSLQTYVWNFGSLSAPDEQQYIAVMTTTTWSQKSFVELVRVPVGQFDQLKLIFIQLIFASQCF
ncbi:hypothetical protein RFI_38152, partial [Reticulomyxa filosa]